MVNDNSNLDQDVLFTRLLDGRARARDWQRLRETTATEAGAAAWDRLIASASDQDVLGGVIGLAGERAELTEVAAAAPEPIPFSPATGRRHDRAVRAARLGWLVAACMALGLVSVALRPGSGASPTTQSAGLGTPALDTFSSADLMNGYKMRAAKEGTLVGELPQRLVLETRPSSDGKGYEVLYMRQLIERAIVDDLYKLGTDDQGRPVIVPTSMPVTRPAGAM
ncbi:MAG TPA: hypothetical protein VEB22_09255 [Phycisphaerales bacterium]|nr:hypothetical protein [Phycisphaerales bacterium]